MVASNEYHFVTRWRLPATPDELAGILFRDAEDMMRWWPSVYLRVRLLEAGDEHGVGARVALFTKGFLPYTLRWQFRITEADLPSRLRLDSEGDFIGRGIWRLKALSAEDTAEGPLTEVRYDWSIRAEKGLLRALSPILRPVFAANHAWAMRQGERSIRLEIARRRATDPVVLAMLPPPPGPTFRITCGSCVGTARSTAPGQALRYVSARGTSITD
jgi:hypothetical protein